MLAPVIDFNTMPEIRLDGNMPYLKQFLYISYGRRLLSNSYTLFQGGMHNGGCEGEWCHDLVRIQRVRALSSLAMPPLTTFSVARRRRLARSQL